MKAVLFERDNRIDLVYVPPPVPEPDDVLVRVGACSICASDLHLPAIKGAGEFTYPLIAGHEVAGTVIEAGQGVAGIQIGAHVVIDPMIPCRTCALCRAGHLNLCVSPAIIGLHKSGGFAEYVAVPAENALPTGGLPDRVAALTEPLACALHGLNRLNPRISDDILIFGVGAMGLLTLQLARRACAGRIVVVDRYAQRLELACQLGATEGIQVNGEQESALEALAGDGFDCVIDASGAPAAVESAFRHVAPAGKLLMLGSCPAAASITVTPRQVQRREMTVLGSFGFGSDFANALCLLQGGWVHVDGIVTHHYPLEAFAAAFEQARSGKDAIKVTLIP